MRALGDGKDKVSELMSRNRRVVVPKVKYPLFQECAKLETAQFWKEIFEKCAQGKFPRNIEYSGGKITHKKGRRKKPDVYFIPNDPEVAGAVLKNVFRESNGLISSSDLMKRKIAQRKQLQAITLPENTCWKDIRAPTTRLLMIHIYVWKEKVRLSLSQVEADSLFLCIQIGLILGMIGNDEIKMKRGNIVSIDGIKRLPNGHFTVEMPEQVKIVHKTSRKKTGQIGFEDTHRKFVDIRNARLMSSSL